MQKISTWTRLDAITLTLRPRPRHPNTNGQPKRLDAGTLTPKPQTQTPIQIDSQTSSWVRWYSGVRRWIAVHGLKDWFQRAPHVFWVFLWGGAMALMGEGPYILLRNIELRNAVSWYSLKSPPPRWEIWTIYFQLSKIFLARRITVLANPVEHQKVNQTKSLRRCLFEFLVFN